MAITIDTLPYNANGSLQSFLQYRDANGGLLKTIAPTSAVIVTLLSTQLKKFPPYVFFIRK
jgi:hypothetical protein